MIDKVFILKTLSIIVLVSISMLFIKLYFVKQYTDIVIKNENINIGRVKLGDNRDILFEITNIGQNKLIIEKIEAECGCTAIERNIVGDNIIITATFSNYNLGEFQKSIKVYCNTENSPLILVFHGLSIKASDM